MYLAIKWNASEERSLQILTPRVMKWAEGVWLMDLRVCLPYWTLLAKREACSVVDLLRAVIEEQTENDAYLVVLANQPWQAVLLLNYLDERELKGFVDRNSNFGSGLYRDVSWRSWWQTALQWGEFCQQVGVKRFQLPSFKRHLKQMQMAVESIGAASPWELQSIGAQAMRRRYGSAVKTLWECSFPETNPVLHLEEDHFPWICHKTPETFTVTRWLDEPSYGWDHVCSHLRDDLDKLCSLNMFTERHKLVCLEWRLTLHDTSTLSIPVHFRHPHSLHSEAQSHGTTLLQANYAFENVMQEKKKEWLEVTDGYAPPIVGWSVTVKEYLSLPARMLSLFGEEKGDDADLIRLENRLPVKLYHYDLKSDWSPEESYAVYGHDTADEQDQIRHSLLAMAKNRPLFLYQRSVPLEQRKARSSLWQFTERTMNKWWREYGVSSSGELTQDYYRYVDNKRRSLWVARGHRNQWYVHGIFA